jgi:hypothetical protein
MDGGPASIDLHKLLSQHCFENYARLSGIVWIAAI